MRVGLFLLLVLLPLAARADEGFFTLDRVPSERIKARYGVAPAPATLARAAAATVQIAQGAGVLVSPRGLVMVKQGNIKPCLHAARDARKTTGRFASLCHDRAIRKALPLFDRLYCQTLDHAAAYDYVAHGHLARTPDEELRCPGLTIHLPVERHDVTAEVKARRARAAPQEQAALEDQIRAEYSGRCAGRPGHECTLVALHGGGRFEFYVRRAYHDVRVVFSPENRVADFGGLEDHVTFPDHDLKAAFVRLYDGGAPVATPQHVRLSPRRLAAGELALMLGYPRLTLRHAPADTLRLIMRERTLLVLPTFAEMRGALSQILLRRPALAALADIDLINFQQVYLRGEVRTLTPELIAARAQEEGVLIERLTARGDARGPALASALAEYHRATEAELGDDDVLFDFVFSDLAGSALLRHALAALNLKSEGGERARVTLLDPLVVDDELEVARLELVLRSAQGSLPADSPTLRKLLAGEHPGGRAAALVRTTRLGDPGFRRAIAAGKVAPESDPMVAFVKDVVPEIKTSGRRRARLRQLGERGHALMQEAKYQLDGDAAYSDGTGSLRVSYGAARGYQDGARAVPPWTTLADLFTRAEPSGPHRLPAAWEAARGKLDLGAPLNLATDHDGMWSSAALFDVSGAVIGLMFMGNRDFAGLTTSYDDTRRRMVSVHVAAVVEALRVIYGAHELLGELGVAR